MTTASISYPATSTLTCSLASLASDTNLVAGRESAAYDNTSNLAVDAIIGGKVTTGTSPTASRQIEVWLAASYDGTSYVGGATGSDANLTPQEKTLFTLVTIIPTVNTSNKLYTWGGWSISSLLGAMPQKLALWFVHNTGVNLNSTGSNHEVKLTRVNYTSA